MQTFFDVETQTATMSVIAATVIFAAILHCFGEERKAHIDTFPYSVKVESKLFECYIL